jgi:serine/threonine-protein kinase
MEAAMSGSRSPGDHDLAESLSRLCNAVCDRFEAAWRGVAPGGPRPVLSRFLPELPEPDRSVILRELILLDVHYRRLAGEPCAANHYLEPFAGLDPAWLFQALQAGAAVRPIASTASGSVSSAPDAAVGPSRPDALGSAAGAAAGPRYTRERLHATGGIGQVWLARDQSIGRQVALKELRPDRAANADMRARFLTEARVTGQLEHPGIVPVYEVAWNPDDGQPFYTMRFIKGRTLRRASADYHQKRRQGQAGPLDLRGLLDAFVSVCNVVAYAHSRGVLHRDLKGQNVVLGDFGEVFLLDWGLAKVVATTDLQRAAGRKARSELTPQTAVEGTLPFPDPLPDLEEATRQLTIEGQVLGTPGYMAPEQAAGQTERITERTDVYGLGAILYELLTGQPPFAGPEVKNVLARVQQDAPVPPRTVNRTVDAALEAICLKALRKVPAERFDSARDLAQEVRCFLAGEPVACYPDPWTVRLRRWMGQHRTLVTGTAAAGLVAVLSLGVATFLLKSANDRERASRLEAEENLRLAHQVVDQYLVQVSGDARLKSLGMEKLRRDLLLQAKVIYEQFLHRGVPTPELQVQRAKALHGLGLIESEIGEREQARALYEDALTLLEEVTQERGAEPGVEDSLAQVARDLAVWHEDQMHGELARTSFERALAIHRRLANAPSATAANHYQLALTLDRFGRFLSYREDAAAAKGLLDEAVRELKPLVATNDHAPEYQNTLAQCYLGLSSANERLGHNEEVEPMLQACLQVRQRLNRSHPDVPVYQYEYGHSLNTLASWQAASPVTEQNKRASATYQQALEVFDRLAYYHPDVPQYVKKRAIICMQIAGLALIQNEPSKAKQALEKGQPLLEKAAKENPDDPTYSPLLLQLHMLEGAWHARQGEHARAAQILAQQCAALARGQFTRDLTELVCFNTACYLCWAADAARADAKLTPTERTAASERYFRQALQTLQQGHAAGCFATASGVQSLKEEEDFRRLRAREDFQKWLKGLEAELAARSR